MSSGQASESEQDAVIAWRLKMFRDLGVALEDAELLANRTDTDWHIVARLIERGCPVTLAVQIVL
jgi:hypothetical protein